jgi:tRNA 2-thiouridine synthesizing protein D
MGKLAMAVFPGLVGNMTYDFALKFAEAAKDKGHDVSIWFSGNATSSVKANQKHLLDYPTGEKHLLRLIEKGVEICTCEACTLARGVKKDESIAGIEWNGMHWYLAKVHGADRALHIGGE